MTTGVSKQNQLKELSFYCKHHKEGNKFIIDEVYKQPTIDKNLKEYYKSKIHIKNIPNFNISLEYINHYGIYYIINNNDIYIGSTINSYRKRFLQHYSNTYNKNMKHTYDLLHSGGTFNILYDMTGVNDVELIRMIENEYIKYFREYTDYNVVNHMDGALWTGKNENNKTKSLIGIKVKAKDYDNVIELLKRYGYIV